MHVTCLIKASCIPRSTFVTHQKYRIWDCLNNCRISFSYLSSLNDDENTLSNIFFLKLFIKHFWRFYSTAAISLERRYLIWRQGSSWQRQVPVATRHHYMYILYKTCDSSSFIWKLLGYTWQRKFTWQEKSYKEALGI